jgi:amino acid transporter
MRKKLKTLFLGPALEDAALEGEKFKVIWGLPIYASDTISSVAYAGEEILLVLFPVMGLAATRTTVGVMCAIIGLLLLLVFCYRQTIDTYPQGGGAYIVGADNLGQSAGLVAAASLSVGYILTVAVSSCSAAAAIVSAAPGLERYKALMAFAIVCVLTWGNLRGMRESSVMFGVPTYLFVASILTLIVTGFVRVYVLGYEPPPAAQVAQTAGDVTVFLLLRAFASGCTALTGVEAVSNGVPSFQAPAEKNAKRVLGLMALIVGVTFISIAALTHIYHITPRENVTAIASLAGAVFGSGSAMFYVFQIATVVILSLAANTAYAGMPLLLAMVARDGYMPRQLTQRGSRLNFSNGVALIFVTASALIFLFNADTHALLPLYATGVFVSFTISQAGMLAHWLHHRGRGWRHKAAINAVGTVICGVVCGIIAVTRFLEGAWVVVVLIPLLVLMMWRIKKHYTDVARQLKVQGDPADLVLRRGRSTRVVVPVQSLNQSFMKALNYTIALGFEHIELYHVGSGDEKDEKLRRQVEALHLPEAEYVSEITPLRNINEVLLRHIDTLRETLGEGETLTVVLPQFVIEKRIGALLHNQTSVQLKMQLNRRSDVTCISVPYILQ